MKKNAIVPFDYSALSTDTKGKVICKVAEIRRSLSAHLKTGFEIGKDLIELQKLLPNEKAFVECAASEFGFSKSTAYNYMGAWEDFGDFPNFGKIEPSAMYLLSSNEAARDDAKKLANKGESVTYTRAKELIAARKPKPPRIEAQKPASVVEDAEFTVVSSEVEAASEEESGEDDSKDAPGTDSPQEEAPRPTRNVKERKPAPGDVPCPNCSNRKWVEGVGHWACTKCGHPHGEPVGDRDEDEVVDERITIKKAKARKTIEAAMREFDDLQVLVPNQREHAEAISMCKSLLNKLKTWN